ncbi:hypothetical protein LUQ84_002655 [Hamiltosporidium tvaerminnensis]|nr:hypothetical protein LUQ84_002655 [Hamiltosporidium tvaerminnensis]
MLYYYLNNRLRGVLEKVNSIQKIEGYIKELFKKYKIFYFQQKELFKEIENSVEVDWIGYKLNLEVQIEVLISMFVGRISNRKCLEIFKEYFVFDGNDFTHLMYNLSCNKKGGSISRDKGVIKELIVDMLGGE